MHYPILDRRATITASALSGFMHFVDDDAVQFVLDMAIEHVDGGYVLRGPAPEE